MKFIFRHFNLLSRPSSIEGHEWVEVHDPEIMIDVKVGLSCLLFLVVSGVMYWIGDFYGSLFYVVMTTFSTLADAVYVNHYYLDLLDRFTAAIGAVYMVWFSVQWFVFHHDWTELMVWMKFAAQILSGALPFRFLEECRKYPVRSENWRDNHVKWHVTGTVAMVLSIMISQGLLDEYFSHFHSYDLSPENLVQGIIELVPLLSFMSS